MKQSTLLAAETMPLCGVWQQTYAASLTAKAPPRVQQPLHVDVAQQQWQLPDVGEGERAST